MKRNSWFKDRQANILNKFITRPEVYSSATVKLEKICEKTNRLTDCLRN